MVGMPPRLIEELRQQRWFAAKDRTVARAEVCDRLALPDLPDVAIELVRVHFGDGPAESYALVRRAAGHLNVEHDHRRAVLLYRRPRLVGVFRLKDVVLPGPQG